MGQGIMKIIRHLRCSMLKWQKSFYLVLEHALVDNITLRQYVTSVYNYTLNYIVFVLQIYTSLALSRRNKSENALQVLPEACHSTTFFYRLSYNTIHVIIFEDWLDLLLFDATFWRSHVYSTFDMLQIYCMIESSKPRY